MRNLLELVFPSSDGEDADAGLRVVSLRQEELVKTAAGIAAYAAETCEIMICSRED
jgi:hypothetical protein